MNQDLPKWKRGDVRQDGKVFFQYVAKRNKEGQRYEWWVTPEQFEKHKLLTKAAGKRNRTRSFGLAAAKGVLQGPKQYKRGDLKPDGSGDRFWNYGGYDKLGNRRERWLPQETYEIEFRKSKEQMYKYWQANRDKHNERLRKSALKHLERRREKRRLDWAENGHIYKAKAKERRRTPEGRKARREAEKRYLAKYPHAKIVQSLRGRLGRILNGTKNFNAGEIERFLGCTKEKLISHLEGMFQEGMSWENYGDHRKGKGWVVDHIVPISHFNDIWNSNDQIRIQEHARLINHFTNLRPLWWQDNLAKGDLKPEWVLVLGRKVWSNLHEDAYGLSTDEDLD